MSARAGSEPLPRLEQDPLLWPLGLLAGLLPLLMFGFLVSVLANRLVYLGWGLVAGFVYYLVLRRGFEQVWHGARHLGAVLLTYAAALAAFGWLGRRHEGAFDEGFRAFLWDYYHPLLTAPRSAFLAAGAVAGVGVLLTVFGLLAERRRRVVMATEVEELAEAESRQEEA